MLKRCLQISDNDIYGHRFNGYDLSKYLRQRDIDCNFLVWKKHGNNDHVLEIAADQNGRKNAFNSAVEWNQHNASHAMLFPFSYNILFEKNFIETDIVHLHLLHNFFFNLSDLPILSKLKPVVWTLHDPWALTGHCVHPMDCERWKTGCGDCPDLTRDFLISHDTTALNWEQKKLIYHSSDLDIVVASKWMYERVSASPLFSKARLHYVPFGIDLSVFKPTHGENAKKQLGIPADNIVISLRATECEWKGLHYVRECLKGLKSPKKITLITFNEEGRLDEFRKRFQVIDLGWVADDEKMITAYNASDIFLMPSTADAFGMMAMEAMCCKKAVIAMSGTALEEVVMPEKGGGIIVPQGDVNALRDALEDLIENDEKRHQIAEQAYQLSR